MEAEIVADRNVKGGRMRHQASKKKKCSVPRRAVLHQIQFPLVPFRVAVRETAGMGVRVAQILRCGSRVKE